jgi:hypothetical protein
MQFRWHLLLGFIASYILVYFFGISLFAGAVIFISSWIIDGDHYLWYSLETKDWNPFNALKWYRKAIPRWIKLSPREKEKFKKGIFIFHGICFWTIILFLSFVNKLFLWILMGIIVHMVADLIDLYFRKEPLYGKLFLPYLLIRNKNKKRIQEL